MKYFIYCRKSSEGEEKQALSLPAQERELKEFASDKNVQIVDIFLEAKSARIPDKRELFNEMINRIEHGECQRILVWHTNRLSRNPKESGIIMQLLTDGTLEEILTPQRSITSENANDILLGVEFGSNAQYSRELSYNTKRGIREKIIRGQWPTLAPGFYINTGEKPNKNIEPDPLNSTFYGKIVDKIVEDRISPEEATRLLKQWGVKSKFDRFFSKNTVHRILRDPVYCGILRYHGYPETKGTWKPLISRRKWDLLQNILDQKGRQYVTKWSHFYKGLITCGKCGLSITAYTKTKLSDRQYTYYCCTKRHRNCGNPPIKENELEEQINHYISQLSLSQDKIDTLKRYTIEMLESELENENRKRSHITTELSEMSQKLDKILTMRLEGELSKDEYLKNNESINSEIEHLENLQKDLKFNRNDTRKQLELFFDELFSIDILFQNGTLEERRRIIRKFATNLTLTDKRLGWNFQKPYQLLLEVKNDPEKVKWGQLLDSFLNRTIELNINLNNIKTLLKATTIDIIAQRKELEIT